MSTLLLVTSSLFGAGSQSERVARDYIAAWQARHPGSRVIHRAATDLPHLTLETLLAASIPPAERTPAQQAAAALADSIVEEAESADEIVLAAPMYNFAIPSTLKTWLDLLARAGRTFRYTAEGPEGLLTGKHVTVVTARGGVYSEGPAKAADHQEPYLRTILGFLGLGDVDFLHLEGLKLSEEAAAEGHVRVRRQIETLLPVLAA